MFHVTLLTLPVYKMSTFIAPIGFWPCKDVESSSRILSSGPKILSADQTAQIREHSYFCPASQIMSSTMFVLVSFPRRLAGPHGLPMLILIFTWSRVWKSIHFPQSPIWFSMCQGLCRKLCHLICLGYFFWYHPLLFPSLVVRHSYIAEMFSHAILLFHWNHFDQNVILEVHLIVALKCVLEKSKQDKKCSERHFWLLMSRGITWRAPENQKYRRFIYPFQIFQAILHEIRCFPWNGSVLVIISSFLFNT